MPLYDPHIFLILTSHRARRAPICVQETFISPSIASFLSTQRLTDRESPSWLLRRLIVGPVREPGGRGSSWRRSATSWAEVRPPAALSIHFLTPPWWRSLAPVFCACSSPTCAAARSPGLWTPSLLTHAPALCPQTFRETEMDRAAATWLPRRRSFRSCRARRVSPVAPPGSAV